ncbi:DUF4240 domain-containing protein [Pseudoxanthomonas sp. X-1]|uniref:DUF4240 domain-containing protein n=1 Tax=Pseudoxanthomonas sp. X-1 TaxID=2571115 RepID=UPI00110AD362|nr:DUF4240 domain-containing protein [Pseudoxanthomonas sp. X-1]TMN20405.1 DUF4240 domain-containing protein [Pseudoxanthomonas sp. X-1]UAY74655.1 DUF4240 domain-containing protein [Pseudoxanthomonas sp. X-1]
MDIDEFWKLMGRVDLAALEAGDEDEALSSVGSALAAMDVTRIAGFQEQLAQVLFAIDGESYVRNAGDSGTSDDGFLYVRCYVVARGERYYVRVKAKPENMPKSIDQWCESLLYVASNAWAARTGGDPEDWEFEASVSYESGSNESLWGATDA